MALFINADYWDGWYYMGENFHQQGIDLVFVKQSHQRYQVYDFLRQTNDENLYQSKNQENCIGQGLSALNFKF